MHFDSPGVTSIPLMLSDGWLVGWVFYNKSIFVGYLTPNPFNANSQLYFKQFSLALVHSLIFQTVLIQLIQFSINIDFVNIQLNVKTILY